MVIGKCKDVYRETFLHCKGEGVMWEDLSVEDYILRGENFHEGVQDFLELFQKTMRK